MAKPKQINVTCKINKVRRINFFENDPIELGLSSEMIQNSKMNLGAGLNIDLKNKMINIAFEVMYFHLIDKNDEKKNLFGIKTQYQFHVPDLDSKQGESGIKIPNDLMLALFATTISGTRGMLELSKTIPAYKELILPMVDTNKIIKDIQHKISDNL